MNSKMNEEERLNLQKMINANDVADQTDKIRITKHSDLIREDVKNFILLKNKYERLAKSNPGQFEQMCLSKCTFLYNNYTDIYNKIKKDEIDISILDKFLIVLKKIEQGEIDQHEGSYTVGKLLKELYVDSALKKSEKLDKREKKNKKSEKNVEKPREISWREYKDMNLKNEANS
tara:strand:- start:76 stop:600 length:525 start_codon:yes stop_codon:yes gene_type:complete